MMGKVRVSLTMGGRIAKIEAGGNGFRDPVKRIARKLGYQDVFFGRQFQERAGAPPGAYRLSRQG
jgi:YesN/AraC family two-component response regulator